MNEAIISKIKKLLALSSSPNESEASVAISKAHQLLKEYNLSMKDIVMDNQYNILEEEYFKCQKDRKWKVLLISEVCNANYCVCLKSTSINEVSYKIVGKEHNIFASKIMLDYLIQTIERLSKKVSGSDRNSYKMGIVKSLALRLRALNKEDQTECKALVLQEKATIQKYFENKNIKDVSINIRSHYTKAYYDGINDGNHISLNHQVSEKNKAIFIA